MISNILKGTLCTNSKEERRRHIPQIQWKCPPKFTMDSNWHVAAGEESTEAATQRRVPTDPRASDNSDSEAPVIPIEEEGNLHDNSSYPFLITTTAMTDETMSLAMAAVAALNSCGSHQGEQTQIDMDSFIQWVNNSETVRRYISGQRVPEIEPASVLNKPTRSVPSSCSNPHQVYFNTSDNCVRENTGVVISEPNALTSSVPSQRSRPIQNVIDPYLRTDLIALPKATQNPDADMRHLSSAFCQSTPLMNLYPLHGNTQVVGQVATMVQPRMPCKFFNTPNGCWNGANCQYVHSNSDQASPSQVTGGTFRCKENEARSRN